MVLSGSASLAVSLGEWERAARFYGAAEAQREKAGLYFDSGREATLMQAQDMLGVSAFAAARFAGRGLSYDEALAEARTWLEHPA